MAGAPKEPGDAALLRMARHRLTHVKASAVYALGAKKPPYLDMGPLIRRVRDAFGPQRVMWASDCPFQVDPGHNYHDSIALIRVRLDFLTESARAWRLPGPAATVSFSRQSGRKVPAYIDLVILINLPTRRTPELL